MSKQHILELLEKEISGSIAENVPMRVPEAVQVIWHIFSDLSSSRTYHGHGPNPISHSEMVAYASLYNWPFRSHDIEAIRALDSAWITAQLYPRNQEARFGRATGEMTPNAFDAVFG